MLGLIEGHGRVWSCRPINAYTCDDRKLLCREHSCFSISDQFGCCPRSSATMGTGTYMNQQNTWSAEGLRVAGDAGFAPNSRGMGEFFGMDVLTRFLEQNQLTNLVRAHETQAEGYRIIGPDSACISIFSAPSYMGCRNQGAPAAPLVCLTCFSIAPTTADCTSQSWK